MKKNTKIILLIVGILTIFVAILTMLYNGDIEERKALEDNREFIIKIGGVQAAKVTMGDLASMDPITFTTVMDTSNTSPTDVEFTGVEVKEICRINDIDLSNASVFEFKALDNYTTAITLDEILTQDNVYVCFKKNGEMLKEKSEGGMGPFLVVIKSSKFSQRWCKYLMEMNIR